MYKTLYVRKADETFWNRAEEMAKGRNQALAMWLSDLIRNHIYDTGAGQRQMAKSAEELLDEAQSALTRARAALASSEPGEEEDR